MKKRNIIVILLVACVLLMVESCGGDDPVALPEVVASFEASETEVLVGERILLTGTSSGSPSVFKWTLPGGSPATSDQENVEVEYAAPGSYAVTLQVSNSQNSDEVTREGYISVYDQLAALFASSDTVIVRGQEVEFMNRSAGSTDTYGWTFEGGSPQTSTEENPTVVYTDLGSFDVTLEVDGFGEAANLSVVDHIVVLDSVEADFETPSGTFLVVEGGQIQFNERSSGMPTEFFWSFEGGSPATSTEEDPLIQYDIPGSYDVTLIVMHEAHADTLTLEDLVEVQEALTADFSQDTTRIGEGGMVAFSDQSAGNPTSWLWEFEGGTPNVSTDQNPTVSYHAIGNFDVKLVVNNGTETKEIIKQDFIKVRGLVADFPFDSDLIDQTGTGNWAYTNISNPTPTFMTDRKGGSSPAASLFHSDASVISNADRLIYNEVTVSVWLNTTLTNGLFFAVLEKYNGTADYGFILALSGGKVYFRGRDKSGNFRDSGPSQTNIADGNWHHVVGVMTTSSTWQIWVDGVKEGEQINGYQITENLNGFPMRLGSSATSALNYNGLYDDLKIYNRALSLAEIQQLFNE